MRSTLFAVSLSLALTLPIMAHGAGERRGRGPIEVTPSTATRVLVNSRQEVVLGRLLVSTGQVSGGEPVLQVTSIGKLNAESFAEKARRGQNFFGPVMAGRQDRTREWVLKRGTTRRGTSYVAFLSGTDPRHPMSQASLARALERGGNEIDEDTAQDMLDDHGFEGSRVPFGKRTHILVVPTTPREHIAKDYVGQIRRADYELMIDLMGAAEDLGGELQLRNPTVFQNTATMTSIGQTHIHLVGELSNPALLRDVEAPQGGRPALLTMDRGKVVPMGADGAPRGR